MEKNYKVYSDVLKKPFDSVKELEEAERIHEAKTLAVKEKKDKLKAERKQRADAIIEKSNAYNEKKKKYADELTKDEQEIQTLINKFVADYGSFHYSYSSQSPIIAKPIDMFDLLGDWINSIF